MRETASLLHRRPTHKARGVFGERDPAHPRGVTFWFDAKTLVGSYFRLSASNRS